MRTIREPFSGLGRDHTFTSVKTEIPGPKSRELLFRQSRYESNAVSYPRRLPIALKHGRGSLLVDEDDNVFIDFLAGAGVLGLGHGHEELVSVAMEQLTELAHGLDFPTRTKDRFTATLLSILPEVMQKDTLIHFCSGSGANAVEAAIKLCQVATGRTGVFAFRGGFHGMGIGTLSLSAEVATRPSPTRALDVSFLPFHSQQRPGCGTACAARDHLNEMKALLEDPYSGVAKPAAVLIELVQGEGGGNIACPRFIGELRALSKHHAVPLIVDEVQTGLGRTGRWFAFNHYNIEPDVVVMSKMLSGVGLPIAAVAYKSELDKWLPGAHTGTFRGNQLAFASGAEFINIVKGENLLDRTTSSGAFATLRLTETHKKHANLIADVRVLGLMIAVEFVGHPGCEDLARSVQKRCLETGLIVETGGRRNAVIRMLPALNTPMEVLKEALDIFDAAVGYVASQTASSARSQEVDRA